ncbi:MAG: MFS transporter [Spirochaetota bacterium]
MKALIRHPLVRSLIHAEGNPKASMYTEPLWGIPFNLYAPFASVYMLALGVGERSIGLIATVGLALQIITSMLGGPITDKLGRKRATFIFDTISWSIPTLLWAFAQSEVWFYLAAFFNSMLRITMTSWTCLFIEDAPKERVVHFWTWVHIAGIVAGFVTPLAGLLIERFELIPMMRLIYLFAFVSMTAKFVILNVVATETRQGHVRLAETAGVPLRALVAELVRDIPRIFRSPGTLVVIVLLAVHAIYITIRGTFFSVLLAEGLAFTPREIGIFPALRSLVVLGFFFFVIPRLKQDRHVGYLLIGIGTTIVSLVILVVAPVRGVAIVTIATIVEAIGAALLAPYLEGFVTAAIDPHHRARILAVANTVVLAVASPFGWIAGVLSEQAKVLPFILAGVVLGLSLVVVVAMNPERGAHSSPGEIVS